MAIPLHRRAFRGGASRWTHRAHLLGFATDTPPSPGQWWHDHGQVRSTTAQRATWLATASRVVEFTTSGRQGHGPRPRRSAHPRGGGGGCSRWPRRRHVLSPKPEGTLGDLARRGGSNRRVKFRLSSRVGGCRFTLCSRGLQALRRTGPDPAVSKSAFRRRPDQRCAVARSRSTLRCRGKPIHVRPSAEARSTGVFSPRRSGKSTCAFGGDLINFVAVGGAESTLRRRRRPTPLRRREPINVPVRPEPTTLLVGVSRSISPSAEPSTLLLRLALSVHAHRGQVAYPLVAGANPRHAVRRDRTALCWMYLKSRFGHAPCTGVATRGRRVRRRFWWRSRLC